MIFGHVNKLNDISLYPELIRKGLRYLADTDFSRVKAGTYELDGENMYAMVQEIETDEVENRRPESHVEYVDIQYLILGAERIGYASVCEGSVVTEDLRPEKDVIFYEAPKKETMLDFDEGSFAVFFPSDIHRPGCLSGRKSKIRKVVIKIKYDMIG
ncbi:MAG: YhcH/YjgK/YiaL family protein [Spirochaetales bacterium]|nr:YhcH/YjgK/YiaL family protein [Spirochaetales bacterium]